MISDDDLSEWLLYRRFVRRLTERNRNFPTVDHKISIVYGFKNNTPPEEISKIENLCITKRKINSSKSHNIESDFITKKDQS